MRCVRAKQIIHSNYTTLSAFFWNIEKWANFWSPISGVSVYYDDGFHQEFSMKVDWEGALHHVRTARFRIGKEIYFFSPISPPPLTLHQGKWAFNEFGRDVFEVEAIRWFDVPSELDSFKLETFKKSFTHRLEKILKGARRACEKKIQLF